MVRIRSCYPKTTYSTRTKNPWEENWTLLPRSVDQKDRAFEFFGSFLHGCGTCFPSMKNTHLVHVGRVLVMWSRSRYQGWNFLKGFDFPERIDSCNALYGGRTNVLQLYYIAQPDEKIHYYDFTSLYLFVNKKRNLFCQTSCNHFPWFWTSRKLFRHRQSENPTSKKKTVALHFTISYKWKTSVDIVLNMCWA